MGESANRMQLSTDPFETVETFQDWRIFQFSPFNLQTGRKISSMISESSDIENMKPTRGSTLHLGEWRDRIAKYGVVSLLKTLPSRVGVSVDLTNVTCTHNTVRSSLAMLSKRSQSADSDVSNVTTSYSSCGHTSRACNLYLLLFQLMDVPASNHKLTNVSSLLKLRFQVNVTQCCRPKNGRSYLIIECRERWGKTANSKKKMELLVFSHEGRFPLLGY